MLDDEPTTPTNDTPSDAGAGPAAPRARSRRRAASRPAGPPVESPSGDVTPAPVTTVAKDAGERTAPAKKSAGTKASAKKTTAKKTTAKKTAAKAPPPATGSTPSSPAEGEPTVEPPTAKRSRKRAAPAVPVVALFQAPEPVAEPRRRSGSAADAAVEASVAAPDAEPRAAASATEPAAEDGEESGRRRRRRGGRGRRGRAGSAEGEGAEAPASEDADETAQPTEADDEDQGEGDGAGTTSRRRRRRRRRGGSGDDTPGDDPERTVVHVRGGRQRGGDSAAITGGKGSTRLEAKKQRRREGREQGRRRPPLLTEAEFLARREAVDRVMVVRQLPDRTQIGVLEDGVLVEHYVARRTATAMAGNVYLGRVQNVLPSMEAAFVDIGRGRNAVLYAGEVNWDAAGLDGQPRRIEHAMKSGDAVLVQVTKDPLGHKGARLTAQVSLPGRYLVYVPDGSMTGISRKLPDTERSRLKGILKRIVPGDAGVIVRTAAEGASEEELERDVTRLAAQWEEISDKAKSANAPALLSEEPDLTVRVIRDIFNEDFSSVVVSGAEGWDTIEGYLSQVAPDLVPRLSRWTDTEDVFTAHRIDEQLAKGLDRKVWLPSGGYLILDPTEAMTVVDVNTGKFTGAGGNLEETVTRNNIEAAEEIVRQLRLRDIGGIIVIDFIDMVLESNRELVLRRLLECLGRDRTKHQVAEVTSLGLVQMTRKRVGQGLLEAFSTPCEACNGRGRHVHGDPVEPKRGAEKEPEPKRGKSAGRRKKAAATVEETRDPAAAAAAAAAVASIAKATVRAAGTDHPGADGTNGADGAEGADGVPAADPAAPSPDPAPGAADEQPAPV